MQFNDYQTKAISTDVFGGKKVPVNDPAFLSKILGLVGEAGEVAEKFKKVFRDENSTLTDQKITELEKELGDVLWYIAVLGSYMGLSLEDIASKNLSKLQARKTKGKLRGSGDNREVWR